MHSPNSFLDLKCFFFYVQVFIFLAYYLFSFWALLKDVFLPGPCHQSLLVRNDVQLNTLSAIAKVDVIKYLDDVCFLVHSIYRIGLVCIRHPNNGCIHIAGFLTCLSRIPGKEKVPVYLPKKHKSANSRKRNLQ